MINEHKSLEDTSAGQEVEKEIQALKRKKRDETMRRGGGKRGAQKEGCRKEDGGKR